MSVIYAGYRNCFIVMQGVVLLNVIMLNVFMLNVVMLNVVAPNKQLILNEFYP